MEKKGGWKGLPPHYSGGERREKGEDKEKGKMR